MGVNWRDFLKRAGQPSTALETQLVKKTVPYIYIYICDDAGSVPMHVTDELQIERKAYMAIGNGVLDKLSDLYANFQIYMPIFRAHVICASFLCDVDTVVGINLHIYIWYFINIL